MGSDGESDQASGTSSDEVQSPTDVCLRNRGNRRISAEVGLPPPPHALLHTSRSHGRTGEMHYGRDEAAVSACFSCLLSVPESFLAAPLPVESDAKHLHVPSGREEHFMSSCCVCDAGESTSLLRSPLWVCPLTGDGPPLLVDRLVVLPAASRRGCSYMLFVLASVDLRKLIKLDMLQW